MSPLVFTPPSVSAGVSSGLVLSDGQTDLDLLGSPPWGLYLVEFTLPVVSRENTYIPGPEGQRRIRSRPQNAVGSARVRIDRQDDLAAAYQADLHALQEMVESAHKRKGTLTFEPPNGQVVIYDIESCQITEAPADGPRMTQRIQEFVIEFECQPYGRLETETLFEDEVFDGPIDSVEIQVVNGHVFRKMTGLSVVLSLAPSPEVPERRSRRRSLTRRSAAAGLTTRSMVGARRSRCCSAPRTTTSGSDSRGRSTRGRSPTGAGSRCCLIRPTFVS
jgi:hypothetical protein